MAYFRHTRDNGIIINNGGNDLIMPLSFFLTQEAGYVIPVGAIWQEYQQGTEYYSSDGVTSTIYSIPWANGDHYISSFATYDANYTVYLANQALPATLVSAKAYQISLLFSQYNSILANGCIYKANLYDCSENLTSYIRNDLNYTIRTAGLLAGYYVYDIYKNHTTVTDVELEELVDIFDEFQWVAKANYNIHEEAINALPNVPAVLGYDITTGWPITPYKLTLTFDVSYYTNIHADYAAGVPVGTAVGGAAIVSHALDLKHNDTRYVNYSAAANAAAQQIGTVRFTLIPNYSGTPAADKVFITIAKADADADNLIEIRHANADGKIYININNNAGAAITATGLGLWNPTAGTEYDFIFYYDITTGDTRLTINGMQLGATIADVGARDASIALLRVGSSYNSGAPTTSNFGVKDLNIYNA